VKVEWVCNSQEPRTFFVPKIDGTTFWYSPCCTDDWDAGATLKSSQILLSGQSGGKMTARVELSNNADCTSISNGAGNSNAGTKVFASYKSQYLVAEVL
jgi:hypothetical protein